MAVPELMQEDVQLVMLGSGDRGTEEWMRSAESICDILLMPSRFEPCGLNQLYAMRYATIPVVHGTGGLRDTVVNFDPFANEGRGSGTGWAFSPLTTESMLWALRLAILTFKEHKSSWEGLMKRAMSRDFTWDNAAAQYEQIIKWAFADPPYVR
uniref:Uncharacterized protein n=1 Tax=Ananas comosus var. bracteatus TaxID=296719 RepID=A0A6V7QKS0_ANACO|nr:unnamed protein product [Ananas comosus var. bracteatus]